MPRSVTTPSSSPNTVDNSSLGVKLHCGTIRTGEVLTRHVCDRYRTFALSEDDSTNNFANSQGAAASAVPRYHQITNKPNKQFALLPEGIRQIKWIPAHQPNLPPCNRLAYSHSIIPSRLLTIVPTRSLLHIRTRPSLSTRTGG